MGKKIYKNKEIDIMDFISEEENILRQEWLSKYNKLSTIDKEKIDKLKEINPKEFQLRVIKRKRIRPQEGDVFVLSPREGMYFYGKVLKSNIERVDNNTFIEGSNVVAIFNCKTREISLEDYKPNYDDLLIRIAIVDYSYWTRGYFYTIANIPLDENEKNIDYGFYSVGFGKFYKSTGEEIMHKPKIFGMNGITTIIGIAKEIESEFIFNPKLLEF